MVTDSIMAEQQNDYNFFKHLYLCSWLSGTGGGGLRLQHKRATLSHKNAPPFLSDSVTLPFYVWSFNGTCESGDDSRASNQN